MVLCNVTSKILILHRISNYFFLGINGIPTREFLRDIFLLFNNIAIKWTILQCYHVSTFRPP